MLAGFSVAGGIGCMTLARRGKLPGIDLLVAGDAYALLTRSAPENRADRDAWASAALKQVTGRPDIAVERRPSGRPRLLPPYPELGVSMSRRGQLLLVGFNPAGRAGVDLEPADSVREAECARLAADHFTAGEAALLARCEPARRVDFFLRLWVAKEAALKLTGRGVYDGLREPDLCEVIGALEADGAVAAVTGSAAVPPHTLVVWREPPGAAEGEGVAVYCAMAVAES
jgi:4'-phosphopantetheinyl transferase